MKTIVFSLVCCLYIHPQLIAQYAYRETTSQEDKIEKVKYDSTFNINSVQYNFDAPSLIGQEIYFAKWSKNSHFMRSNDTIFTDLYSEKENVDPTYDPNEVSQTTTKQYSAYQQSPNMSATGLITSMIKKRQQKKEEEKKEEVSHNYVRKTKIYMPVKVKGQHQPFTPYSALENRFFKVIDCEMGTVENNISILNMQLLDDKGDTLDWRHFISDQGAATRKFEVNGNAAFIKSYIEYLKDTYVNKKLYVKNEDWLSSTYQNVLDNKSISIKAGDIWFCSDINFVSDEENNFSRLVLILKNDNGAEVAAAPYLYGSSDRALPIYAFWTESEYTAYLEREKKKQDAAEQERLKEEALQMAEEKKNKDALVKKYGKYYGSAIADGNVKLGMTKEMCELAWGYPFTTVTKTYKGGTVEVWMYGVSSYLRFTGNTLSMIVN